MSMVTSRQPRFPVHCENVSTQVAIRIRGIIDRIHCAVDRSIIGTYFNLINVDYGHFTNEEDLNARWPFV